VTVESLGIVLDKLITSGESYAVQIASGGLREGLASDLIEITL